MLFIDASSECIKVTNNNKLTPENINKIVDTFAQRAEEAHFSHLAEYSEVQENDYNLRFPLMWKPRTPARRSTL